MAKAKKSPSGNWRVRVYSHTDYTGKKVYKSFTASTKAEAELMAAQFKNNADRKHIKDITVKQAVEDYLTANNNVLSPSTLNGYRKDSKSFEPINHLRIQRLTSKDLQMFISDLIDKGLSPKTVKNRYGLLRTVLRFSGVQKDFMIHLPKEQKKKKYAPETNQITTLYENANRYMKIAISLGCYSLRRGEVAGLKYGDLKGNALYVHSDVVKSADGKTWVHKEIPKTDDSNRTIKINDQILELIGTGDKDDYIVPLTPGTIGTEFYNLKKQVGINIRFHDLRVYFASIMKAMGASNITTAHLGGWKENSPVLRQVYQKPIESIDNEFADLFNEHLTQNITKNMT